MILYICDRCGKQIDRFVHNTKYGIQRNRKEYGFSKDRERRIRADDAQAYYLENLKFCEECEKALTDILDKELSDFPNRVTLNTEL